MYTEQVVENVWIWENEETFWLRLQGSDRFVSKHSIYNAEMKLKFNPTLHEVRVGTDLNPSSINTAWGY